MAVVDCAPATPTAQPPDLHGRSVLVVDDNLTNQQILKDLLQRWGMVVSVAGNTTLARAQLEQKAHDLMLLDFQMPDMDGFAFAADLRAHPPGPGIPPTLMLTSGPHKGDAQRSLQLGLVGFFTKPLPPAELLVAVQRALGAAAQGTPAPRTNALITRHQIRETSRVLKVLLVEDQPVNQKLMTSLMQRWGHEVTLAQNGSEAVALAAGPVHFDVVFMDMQMPVMDGLEATRRIRAHEQAHTRTPLQIIAMTANAMSGDEQACLDAGMNDYISKPISTPALLARLQRL